jgi:hypothetical protein
VLWQWTGNYWTRNRYARLIAGEDRLPAPHDEAPVEEQPLATKLP